MTQIHKNLGLFSWNVKGVNNNTKAQKKKGRHENFLPCGVHQPISLPFEAAECCRKEIRLRWNRRKYVERYVPGHISIDDLKRIYRNQSSLAWRNTYLDKSVEPAKTWRYSVVPRYPQPVEFRVSRISHVTDLTGLSGILKSGFGGLTSGSLCWELVIGSEEISKAEQRYLEKLFPHRNREQQRTQRPFLHKFTTSPKFRDESRYGNFRFSFSLANVLQAYSTQLCGGQSPVLRVYETVIYKQEVMYVVLIHSPDVHGYDDYPVLGDNDDGVCAYRDGEIIWRAQAISETHRFRLIENRYKKQVHVEDAWSQFYVWDHVTLVFHRSKGESLTWPGAELLEALTACDTGNIVLNKAITDKASARDIVWHLRHNRLFYHK